jgi:hypothetical protein
MLRADALTPHGPRRTLLALLLALASSMGLGCVDITPPWEKAGWSNPDSGIATTKDTGAPMPPDGAVIKDDAEQAVSPDSSVDAAREQVDSPEPVDAQADTPPLDPDARADTYEQTQDGRPDAMTDTRRIDSEDAFVKRDQGPDLDSEERDTLSSDLAPDVTAPPMDAGPEALPTQGLVAYYPCESANGSVLADRSGNKRNATLANGSGGSSPAGFTFASGKVGNGMGLNPNDTAYVSLPKGIASQLSQMTVASWVKMNASKAYQRIFDFGMDSNTFMYLSNFGTTGVRFRISSSNGKNQALESTTALPVGIWTHVALTLGDDGISLFVDGKRVVQQAPAALRASDLGDTSNNYIGRSQFTADPYLDGAIDEFRIYDRVLDTAEITDLASGR